MSRRIYPKFLIDELENRVPEGKRRTETFRAAKTLCGVSKKSGWPTIIAQEVMAKDRKRKVTR